MLGEDSDEKGEASAEAVVMECLRESVGGGRDSVDGVAAAASRPLAEARMRKGGASGTTEEGDGEHKSSSPVALGL